VQVQADCAGRMHDRVVIVTGGSSGIGAATCQVLAREGAKVIVADVNESLGRSMAEEIGGYFVKVDVANEDDWMYLMQAVELKYGKIDGLVNNAGIALGGNIETTSNETWKKLQGIHMDGTFYGCKHGIGLMKKSETGWTTTMFCFPLTAFYIFMQEDQL
jgi:3(or 17)beta-hydroxysteroid dehydrogenase